MELPQRPRSDIFLPTGHYLRLQHSLARRQALAGLRALVVSAFDRTTRMHPFVYADRYIVPCGPRSIAASLVAAGLARTRFVFQLWNPNIRPSLARIENAPPDLLLVSSMQIHSAASYKLIEDAWSLGQQRPFIIAGGPKATYQPFDYFALGPNHNLGADVVVTGEEPILLEFLDVLAHFGAKPGAVHDAFRRARQAGALDHIPGLVYPIDEHRHGLNLHNTGPQRLLRELDGLPLPSVGFATLEPPHRRQTLDPKPMPMNRIGRDPNVISLLITRGCKFHCHYCPIPAYNQRTLRQKSPQRVVAEFTDCLHNLNAHAFFGADDNFLNNRKVAQDIFQAVASATYNGKPLGSQIEFMTEVTVIDTWKNRDLLPLARQAGVTNLWMGVEDLAARLVNKGQTPDLTKSLFKLLLQHRIAPRVMLMHHDEQPLRQPRDLVGLLDQIEFLAKAGAVGCQCTVASPSLGSRWISDVIANRQLYYRIRQRLIDDTCFDGNHVVASTNPKPWQVQLNLLRGYAAFYNPATFFKSLLAYYKPCGRQRVVEQLRGLAATARTAWRLKGYLLDLYKGPIKYLPDWPPHFRRPGSPYPELITSPEPTCQTADLPQHENLCHDPSLLPPRRQLSQRA